MSNINKLTIVVTTNTILKRSLFFTENVFLIVTIIKKHLGQYYLGKKLMIKNHVTSEQDKCYKQLLIVFQIHLTNVTKDSLQSFRVNLNGFLVFLWCYSILRFKTLPEIIRIGDSNPISHL